jgi:multidrug efflux system membrane fusion protein
VKADQAAIDSAQVQVNYTSIYSPIDGRTGIRQVDQGNIVHATDTNGLVVLTQLQPITVLFTLPEQDLVEIHRQQAAGGGGFKILAVGRDEDTPLDEGTLAVIDNQIDTTTGTIRLKGTFPNKELNLWPGQFVNVRFLLCVRHGGLVVPAPAIQRGPNGAYVFVIDGVEPGDVPLRTSGQEFPILAKEEASGPVVASGQSTGSAHENKGGGLDGAPPAGSSQSILAVHIRPVKAAPQEEAGEVLIESGLHKGELVVVDGQYKLQEGSTVKINDGPKSENPHVPVPDASQ